MTRQAEILQAAIALAQERGFGALSVRSVAQAAGIGPTTLRHYYPSQADLHRDVADQLFTMMTDDRSIHDAASDPADRLYDCLRQFLPEGEQQRLILEAWFQTHQLALGGEPQPVAQVLLRTGYQTSRANVRRWLGILADEGHLDRQDIDRITTSALALIDGLALHLLTAGDDVDAATAQRSLRWFAEQIVRPTRA